MEKLKLQNSPENQALVLIMENLGMIEKVEMSFRAHSHNPIYHHHQIGHAAVSAVGVMNITLKPEQEELRKSLLLQTVNAEGTE